MKTGKIYILLSLAALITTLYACTHESGVVQPVNPGGGGTGGGGGGTPTDTSICFERDILPIFTTNCAKSGCHNAASRQDGYVLDSYQNIIKKGIRPGDAEDSDIYEALVEDDEDDRMPQAPNPRLSNEQIALIRRWINEGAKNGTNCPTLCDTSRFAFNADIKPILQQNCTGCHSSAAPSKGVALDTYAGVQSVALDGRLMRTITHSAGIAPMPQGAAKLIDCRIAQIRKWVEAGAPNN